MQSDATTVKQYLAELSKERKAQIETVREVILENLPEGYEEAMNFGMISYQVPLETYPDTYNKKPLLYAALANQKNYMSVYLMGIYSVDANDKKFEKAYKATGKRYDVGKSCVRFRKPDDLPLDLIGETIASITADDFVENTKNARAEYERKKKAKV